MADTLDDGFEDAQHRRNRLQAWINDHFGGVQAAFVKAHDLNQSEISGLLRIKSFGSVKARKLERAAGMPPRYLDDRTSPALLHGEAPRSPPLTQGSSSSELPARHDGVLPATFVYAGASNSRTGIPVRKTIRVKADGFYEEAPHSTAEGTIAAHATGTGSYAVKVRGDSLAPAIRDGYFLVIEPDGKCVEGEEVLVSLVDGERMCKRLLFERSDTVTFMNVGNNETVTIERTRITAMLPIAAIYPPSKWRPN